MTVHNSPANQGSQAGEAQHLKREKNCRLHVLYLEKHSFKTKERIKPYQTKKTCVTSRLNHKDWWGKFFKK